MTPAADRYRLSADNAVSDGVYVFVIETFVFQLLAVGVAVNDGVPVLPGAVLAVFFVAWLCMVVVLMAVRLGFPKRTVGPFKSSPPCVIMSLLQAATHHVLAAFCNLVVVAVLTLSYTGSLSAQYFSVIFRARPGQPELWYLSRAGIMAVLAVSFVIVGCLLSVFSFLREYVPGKEKMRAHFMGFVNAYIFFNIAIMFLMQNTIERVCKDLGETCDLTQFQEETAFDFLNYILFASALILVMILDFMADLGYSATRDNGKKASALIGVYVGSRVILCGLVWVLYVFSEPLDEILGNAALPVFPLWFRIMHACVHSFSLVLETLTAFSRRRGTPDTNVSAKQGSTEVTAVDFNGTGPDASGSVFSDSKQMARARPRIFFKRGLTSNKKSK